MAQYTVKFPRLGYVALVLDADTDGNSRGKATMNEYLAWQWYGYTYGRMTLGPMFILDLNDKPLLDGWIPGYYAVVNVIPSAGLSVRTEEV